MHTWNFKTWNFKNYRSDSDLSIFMTFVDRLRLSIDSSFLKTTAKKEINKLVEQLKQLPNVTDVVVAKREPNNLQEITFKILANVDFATAIEIEKKAISLIVDTEWLLCDFYKNEDWHFDMQLVSNADFSFVKI